MMDDQIKEYQQRVKGYENIDGTVEMLFGLMWLSAPLVRILLEARLAGFGRWGSFLSFNAIWLTVVGLGWWGQKIIKRRITYARTGYLLHRRDPKRIVLALTVSAVSAAALVLILNAARQSHAVSLGRLAMCAFAVATYAFAAMVYSPEHKWKLLVVLFMALFSVPVCFAGWSDRALSRTMELFFGLTWFLSGLATLYLYLQRTRPAVSE